MTKTSAGPTAAIVTNSVSHDEAFCRIFARIRSDTVGTFRVTRVGAHLMEIIDSGKNRFRTGMVGLVGDITGCDWSLTARLAMIAEYSWAAILVFDDISDNETLRRGRPTLRRSHGLLFATQAAVYAAFDAALTLDALANDQPCLAAAANSYAAMMRTTANGQLLADELRIDSTNALLIRSMLAKTAPLRWAVQAAGHCNRPFTRELVGACRALATAATIKNDLDDFSPPDALYESRGTDASSCQVTYPIKILAETCTPEQQSALYRTYADRRPDNEERAALVSHLYAQYPQVERICRAEIRKSVEAALHRFSGALPHLTVSERASPQIACIENWIRSYAPDDRCSQDTSAPARAIR